MSHAWGWSEGLREKWVTIEALVKATAVEGRWVLLDSCGRFLFIYLWF